ncbi:MAG: hypothetical protein AAB074_19895 [Planctomycetota bacterium]
MGAGKWILVAAACAASLGCDTKPIGPKPGAGGAGSGPRQEVDTARKETHNPAPLIDPMGSLQVYKGAKHDIQCPTNLRSIGACLLMYTTRTGEYPPPGAFFRKMLESGDITDFNICAIPRSNATRDEVQAQMGEKAYRVTMDKLNDSTSTEKPIVWDPVPFQDGRHVLLLSGTVVDVTEDAFQGMMAKWEGK